MSILGQLQGKAQQQRTPPPEPPRSGGIFGRIADAQPSRGGVYVLPGNYVCRVQSLKMILSRRGDHFFVAELDVVESDVPDRPVGSTMDWMANLSQHDAAIGNVRGAIAAIAGCPLDEVDEVAAEASVHEANPLGGRLVRLAATNIQTKAGNDFTVVRWFAVPEDLQRGAGAAALPKGIQAGGGDDIPF